MNTENNQENILSEATSDVQPKKQRKNIFKMDGKSFDGYYLIAAFIIPFMLMLAVYVCMKKHPFGNQSVLTLDMQAQYVYYFEALRRLLTEGGSWLYSWERTLGGEMMGIVAYYLASPFNLIVALFPKSMIPDAIMFIQLTKVGAMGVTFAYYLRKTRNTSDMVSVSFGTMYALSAYSVVQLCNVMWLDAMVFLPLLILGVEAMIRERKFILYTVSLVLIFCSNYYIGYMCAIFTFVYYLYYFFLVRQELIQNEGAKSGPWWKRLLRSNGLETFIRFGVFTVIAGMISAFVLLCAWYSLSFGKTEFSNPNFYPSMNFDFLDLFVKMLPGSFDTVQPDGLPMIYCGVLALVAIPLFYMSPAISKKKKALSALVLAFIILSFMVNTIDLAWHGFSAPNWLEFRNSFIAIFFLLILACDGIRTLKKIPFGKVMTVSVALCLLIMIIQKFGYVFQQGPDVKVLDDTQCILFSVALVIIYAIILYFMRQTKWEGVAAFALAAIVCVEMFLGALMNIVDLEEDVGSIRYSNWLSESGKTEYYGGHVGSVKRLEEIVNEVYAKDSSFFRMESTVYRKKGGVNEPFAVGMKGISHSTSTLNEAVIKLMRKLGYTSESHWTKYIGGSPIADALLGIKYVVTKNNALDPNIYEEFASVDEYYEYIPSTNKIYAMQNTKALSLAYGVSNKVLEMTDFLTEPKYYSSLELQNKLINTMLSGVMSTPDVLRGIYASPNAVDCKLSSFTNMHTLFDEKGKALEEKVDNRYYVIEDTDNEGTVTFDFEAKQDGDIYMYLPGCLFTDSATMYKIYVNDVMINPNANETDYFTGDTWSIINIGTFKNDDKITVRIEFSGGKMYFSAESPYYFYYIDYAKMNVAFEELYYASMDIKEYGNDYVKGEIYLPAGQELIFTTIPYDEGWKVYIDGERVETVKVLDSLLAIPSTEGDHTIEFVYRPNCAVYGGLITVVGIIAFALIVIFSRMRRVRRAVKCDDGKALHFFYCEGDVKGKWLMEAAEVCDCVSDQKVGEVSSEISEEIVTDEARESEPESDS